MQNSRFEMCPQDSILRPQFGFIESPEMAVVKNSAVDADFIRE